MSEVYIINHKDKIDEGKTDGECSFLWWSITLSNLVKLEITFYKTY